MHSRIIAVIALATLLATGCAPRTTPIGPGHSFQPDEREKRLWSYGTQISSELQAKGQLYPDPALAAYVQSVLDRLLGQQRSAYSPLTLRVYILDAPSVNAFALPHGDIFVHSGLLGRVRNEAQLAMVLGHELTHATHRHSYQSMQYVYASSGAYAYIAVISSVGGGNVQNLVAQLGGMMTLAAISGYSREKEEESDRIGLTLIAQAGYDPMAGAEMFQQMLDATDPDRHWNVFYASHPKMKERAATCKRLATTLPLPPQAVKPERGEERYVAIARGLILDEVERHVAQGRYKLAEETLAFLLRVRPNEADVYARRGDLCRARAAAGDAAEARQAYERALALQPGCPPAHRGLGLLCAQCGDRAEAIRHLNAYLAKAGGAPDAAYIRQYVDRLSRGD